MKSAHNITQIADLLGRSKSTISPNLRRNAGGQCNRTQQACELSKQRARSRNAALVATWLKDQAIALLQMQWSPERVAGTLTVSHEKLYQYVYADKAHGGTSVEESALSKAKENANANGRDRRGQIPNRRPLSERLAYVEGRKQVGHWECDTVIGANHKQAIVTVVERKSGYAVMAKASNKTTDLVGAAITQALKPFASWKRGSNENFNGLLRQYMPKKRHMTNITHEEIKIIENRLNNRPCKRLGFRTPAEVFHQSLSRVALRA
jgi:IS30 family transposase